MLNTRRLLSLAAAAAIAVLPFSGAMASPDIGMAAPAFTGMTAQGTTLSLEDFRGKTVVLEWTNKDCPYVRKHYGTNNMQALQKESKAEHDVTWISIISSAPGEQGYLEAQEALANIADTDAAPDHLILDPNGEIGRLYAARTTPEMFIINPEGVLTYKGGIDDKPSSNWKTVEGATNFVRAALDDMADGRDVAQAVTRPYGCSVKYLN